MAPRSPQSVGRALWVFAPALLWLIWLFVVAIAKETQAPGFGAWNDIRTWGHLAIRFYYEMLAAGILFWLVSARVAYRRCPPSQTGYWLLAVLILGALLALAGSFSFLF